MFVYTRFLYPAYLRHYARTRSQNRQSKFRNHVKSADFGSRPLSIRSSSKSVRTAGRSLLRSKHYIGHLKRSLRDLGQLRSISQFKVIMRVWTQWPSTSMISLLTTNMNLMKKLSRPISSNHHHISQLIQLKRLQLKIRDRQTVCQFIPDPVRGSLDRLDCRPFLRHHTMSSKRFCCKFC